MAEEDRRSLGLAPFDPERDSLFEVRRAGPVPAWLVAALTVCGFLATVFCTWREYRASGTVFGFPGPAFNVLVSPIWEELVFRGWILQTLARRRSSLFAIAASSLLFGLFHVRNVYWLEPWPLARQMLWTGLVVGPVLAWLTLRFRSLWPAVVGHYAHNLAYYL
jgi:membrane protease YdiL (CAAX protease family)